MVTDIAVIAMVTDSTVTADGNLYCCDSDGKLTALWQQCKAADIAVTAILVLNNGTFVPPSLSQ